MQIDYITLMQMDAFGRFERMGRNRGFVHERKSSHLGYLVFVFVILKLLGQVEFFSSLSSHRVDVPLLHGLAFLF